MYKEIQKVFNPCIVLVQINFVTEFVAFLQKKIIEIFSIYFRVQEEEYEDHHKLALLSHPLKLKFKLFQFSKTHTVQYCATL